jgi:hypothetical protein
MQDRYAGDVGDFSKFGLLRRLGRDRALGVVWYLYPNEGNRDGRHIEYLTDARFRACDRELFDTLNTFVTNNSRSVAELERSAVLPDGTRYFSTLLDYGHIQPPAFTPRGREARLAHRKTWVTQATQAMDGCEIVFLDPDNGLEVPSVNKHSTRGPKFVYFDELHEFMNVDSVKIIVVYHHLNRHINYGDHERQMRDRANEIRKAIGSGVNVSSVRFRPYSPRGFFIITRYQDEFQKTNDMLRSFLDAHWSAYFTMH